MIESHPYQPRLLYQGVARTLKSVEEGDRLRALHQALLHIVQRFDPQEAAVEELYFAANQKTALRVAQARGVVLLALSQQGLATHAYTPLQVKKTLTGQGKADKRQVSYMVRALLGLPQAKFAKDAADAVAVALTHERVRRLPRAGRASAGRRERHRPPRS